MNQIAKEKDHFIISFLRSLLNLLLKLNLFLKFLHLIILVYYSFCLIHESEILFFIIIKIIATLLPNHLLNLFLTQNLYFTVNSNFFITISSESYYYSFFDPTNPIILNPSIIINFSDSSLNRRYFSINSITNSSFKIASINFSKLMFMMPQDSHQNRNPYIPF